MNEKILVVDDDPQIRGCLSEVLQFDGYEAVLAADGEEGIGKINSQHIDLVLLDLNLSGESGWDIFERVTASYPLLPIIIITGQPNQYAMAAAAGAGALLEKPLDARLLLQTISRLLAELPESRFERLAALHNDGRHSATASNRTSNVEHFPAASYRGWGINE